MTEALCIVFVPPSRIARCPFKVGALLMSCPARPSLHSPFLQHLRQAVTLQAPTLQHHPYCTLLLHLPYFSHRCGQVIQCPVSHFPMLYCTPILYHHAINITAPSILHPMAYCTPCTPMSATQRHRLDLWKSLSAHSSRKIGCHGNRLLKHSVA